MSINAVSERIFLEHLSAQGNGRLSNNKWYAWFLDNPKQPKPAVKQLTVFHLVHDWKAKKLLFRNYGQTKFVHKKKVIDILGGR